MRWAQTTSDSRSAGPLARFTQAGAEQLTAGAASALPQCLRASAACLLQEAASVQAQQRWLRCGPAATRMRAVRTTALPLAARALSLPAACARCRALTALGLRTRADPLPPRRPPQTPHSLAAPAA
jgi:hypothetical protein